MRLICKVPGFKWIGLMAAFIVVISLPAHSQYYDLSVGTERHYDDVSYLDVFPRTAVSTSFFGIERVIGETELNGETWAVVEWVWWIYRTEPSGTYLIINSDTLYYKMSGPVLYEFVGSESKAIFDFDIAKGDSMYSRFKSYLPLNRSQRFDDIENYGGTIIVNDTITFPDGKPYMILWGDGSSSGPDPYFPIPLSETFIDEILIEHEGWLYPYNSEKTDLYHPFLPFFYVEGIGSIYNIFNHRGYYMSGYKSADGQTMGVINVVPTSIENGGVLPSSLVLFQNYPNPFNPSTLIRWQLPFASAIKLTVYDLLGREVTVLAEGTFAAGMHEAVFNAANLSSGVYLYRLETPTQALTGKMLLVK